MRLTLNVHRSKLHTHPVGSEMPPCGSENLPCSHDPVTQGAYNYWASADPDPNWRQGLKVGYGPGVMHGRRQKYKGVRNNTQHFTFLTRLTFTAADGTEYELRDVKEGGNPRYVLAGQDLSRGTIFVSADGVSATFVSDTEIFEKQNNVHRIPAALRLLPAVGVTRHDYLPFGGELPGDAVWRTPARGYAPDGLRQKFTGYERDVETGLDFAQARYYAPLSGRSPPRREQSNGHPRCAEN